MSRILALADVRVPASAVHEHARTRACRTARRLGPAIVKRLMLTSDDAAHLDERAVGRGRGTMCAAYDAFDHSVRPFNHIPFGAAA